MNLVVWKIILGIVLWTVQYNGCKWKGGVLRVEKAKENYMDRLRREWAETEAEAAVKAKIAEKAAANDYCQSRPMYSSKFEDVSGSPESNRVDFVEVIGEEGKTVITSPYLKTLLVCM